MRTPLPEGTIPVGIALLIAGFATYAFFRVGTVAVGGEDAFAPIASLWFAMFALSPGFFLPLEQELGRALASRRALGQGSATCVPERSQGEHPFLCSTAAQGCSEPSQTPVPQPSGTT